MEKLFAEQNAKWEQRFADQDCAGARSSQSERPSPSPATTTFPAVADAAAAPAAPPEGTDVGRELPLAAHVTSTAAGAAEIVDSVGLLSASRLHPGAVAPLQKKHPHAMTCFPAPRAQGADKDDNTSTTPTRCSTDCFSRNIVLLKATCVAPTSTLAPATPSAEDGATNNSSASSFKCIQVRYISTSTPSYSIGVVLPCMATRVPDVKLVLEGLIAQKSC